MVKNLPASAGDVRGVDWTPGSGRSSGGGRGNPLQYPCLDRGSLPCPVDRGAWWATAHGVAKNQTRLKQVGTHAHPSLKGLHQTGLGQAWAEETGS